MFLFCKRWDFTLKNKRNASKQNAVPWCYSSWDPLDISYSLTVWIRSFSRSFVNRAVGTADFSVWLVNKEIGEKLIRSAQAELCFSPSCFAKQQWQRRWTRPQTRDLFCLGRIDSSFSQKMGHVSKEKKWWFWKIRLEDFFQNAKKLQHLWGREILEGGFFTKLDPQKNYYLLPWTTFFPKFVPLRTNIEFHSYVAALPWSKG